MELYTNCLQVVGLGAKHLYLQTTPATCFFNWLSRAPDDQLMRWLISSKSFSAKHRIGDLPWVGIPEEIKLFWGKGAEAVKGSEKIVEPKTCPNNCFFCGFKAQQCLGQQYGLQTLSTSREPPFLTTSSASRLFTIHTRTTVMKDIFFNIVFRARGLEFGGRGFESWSLHLKPETKLHEERELCYGKLSSNLVISDCASDSRYKR